VGHSFPKMGSKSLVILALLVIPSLGAYAQGGGAFDNRGSVHGTVVMPNGGPLTTAVRVTLKVLKGDITFTYSDQLGRFQFPNVAGGQYVVEVDPPDSHFEAVSERVTVSRGGGPTLVTLYLKEKKAERGAAQDNTISVAMLDQKIPSAARHEFERASKLEADGKEQESIEALKRALAIYPTYVMALNDLGAQLMNQGKLEEAANQLRSAVEVDPHAFNPLLNLGIVLMKQNKFSESAAILDKALSVESSAPAAHLYLGIVSIKLADADRAAQELTAAHELGGVSYSVALLHLGQLYLKKGQRQLALKSFESYLKESPNGANVPEVQKLVASLR
jgi:lipopolysaccharide biosynthesis regulator YciM